MGYIIDLIDQARLQGFAKLVSGSDQFFEGMLKQVQHDAAIMISEDLKYITEHKATTIRVWYDIE